MFEEFVNVGKWWLPNKPEKVVPGKLSFSPENGATLELIGSFYDSQFEEIGQAEDFIPPREVLPFRNANTAERVVPIDFIKPEEIIILGLLESNEEITLYKCSGLVKNFEFAKGRPTLLFHVNYIFRKIHFQEEQDIKIKSISVQYSHLEEWIGKSGIEVLVSEEGNRIWFSYQPPPSIHLTNINNLEVSITFSQIYLNPFDVCFGATYYKANIEQKTYLTIENNYNEPLDKCIELLIDFRDLLSFAMSKPSFLISVTGNVDVTYQQPVQQEQGTYILKNEIQETKIIILFGLGNSEKHFGTETYRRHEMLFTFSDVEDRLGKIFKEWLKKRETYEPVFDLLMITMYTPSLYLHYHFLNAIQALEVYHANKYKGTYQDDKVYKQGIYKELLEVIENFPGKIININFWILLLEIDELAGILFADWSINGISREFRAALKGKLNFQNQVTLQTRLKEIFKDIFSLLPNDFIGSLEDRTSFVSRASKTRNALTHHNKRERKKAARGRELLQLFHTLSVILQICILRELSFTDDSIKTLIARNRDYQKEWRPSLK